jgi:hypothetical protein
MWRFAVYLCFQITGMKTFLFALFVSLGYSTFAQEASPVTLQLMNGKVMEVYGLNDSSFTNLQYQFDKNYFKRERLNNRERREQEDYFNQSITTEKADALPVVLREGATDREDVMSIVYSDGSEKMLYMYDEPVGNVLTEMEMRSYVTGSRDARVAITGKVWFYAGLGVGAVASYATSQSILALAIPPVFALSAKIPTIKIPKKAISDPLYYGDMDYAAGFERTARSKNVREGLKGSAIGTIIGLVAYTLIDNNF